MIDYSVVIPTFNRISSLKRSIESVENQIVQPRDIIVVDDASTEVSVKENLSEYKVTVVSLEHNQGAAAARNIGVSFVKSDFVAFLDSDDVWPDYRFLEVSKYLDADVDLCYTDMMIVETNGKLKKSGKDMVYQDFIGALISGWTAPNTSTLVFRTASFLAVGGFNVSLRTCEDHELWFRCAVKPRFNIICINKPLSYFTRNSNNRLSNSASFRLNSMEKFLALISKEYSGKFSSLHSLASFKREYFLKVAFPLVKHDPFSMTSLKICVKYLIFNSKFYSKVGLTIIKKLRLK